MTEKTIREKLRIRSIEVEEDRCSKSKYYEKCSIFRLQTLRTPSFQFYLTRVLRREEIDESEIRDIQVRVYPRQSVRGNWLVGRCNSKGVIALYPKKRAFCRELAEKWGEKRTLLFIKFRAWATLIHESLHLKYADEEKRVRRLTRKYLRFFIRKNYQETDINEIAQVIFNK